MAKDDRMPEKVGLKRLQLTCAEDNKEYPSLFGGIHTISFDLSGISPTPFNTSRGR